MPAGGDPQPGLHAPRIVLLSFITFFWAGFLIGSTRVWLRTSDIFLGPADNSSVGPVGNISAGLAGNISLGPTGFLGGSLGPPDVSLGPVDNNSMGPVGNISLRPAYLRDFGFDLILWLAFWRAVSLLTVITLHVVVMLRHIGRGIPAQPNAAAAGASNPGQNRGPGNPTQPNTATAAGGNRRQSGGPGTA